MATVSLSSAINGKFVTALQLKGRSSSGINSTSVAKFTSGDQVSLTLNKSGKILAGAFTNLNSSIAFLDETRSTLEKLGKLVDKVVQVAENASKSDTSQGTRNNLAVEYKRLGREFAKILGNSKLGDFDKLKKDDITQVLTNAGLDPKKSDEIAALLKKILTPSESNDQIGSDQIKGARPLILPTQTEASGSFETPVTYATTTASAAVFSPLIQDFNGDGILDIITGGDASAYPEISLGNGDGTFGAANQISNIKISYGNIQSADLNGDGILDLFGAYSDNNGSIEISLGVGDGTFTDVGTIPSFSTVAPLYVTAGDLNNDGILDLVASGNSASNDPLSVFIGNGDGTFQGAAGLLLSDGNSHTQQTTINDFNGDGNADIAVVSANNNNVDLFFGDGTGGFGSTGVFDIGSVAVGQKEILSADIDGDGNIDLITSNLSGTGNDTLITFLGNGDGTFGTGTSYAVANGTTIGAIRYADVTGNGTKDLVAIEDGGYVNIFEGRNNGTFATSSTGFFVTTHTAALGIGDLNNDGYNDIATGSQSGESTFDISLAATQEASTHLTAEFDQVFDSARSILKRVDAVALLADAKALKESIKKNIIAVDDTIETIANNRELTRVTALAFFDSAKDSAILGLRDADKVAEAIRSNLREKTSSKILAEVGNLDSLVAAVTLSSSSK